MAHTYTHILIHMFFSTKERVPAITPALGERLYPYLGGLAKKVGCKPMRINGPDDHVHLILSIPPTIAIAVLARELKARSSGWLHETFADQRDFDWQDGYTAYSISQSDLPALYRYVANQREHHRRVSFRDELIALLKAQGTEYDERYLLG